MIFNSFDGIAISATSSNGQNIAQEAGVLGNQGAEIDIQIGNAERKRNQGINVLETGFDSIAIGVKLALGSLTNGIGNFVRGRTLAAAGDIDGTHLDFKSRGVKSIGKNRLR